MNGFLAGVLHPLEVPTHVLALAATGLMIGQQDRVPAAVLLALFAAALAAGLAALALAVRQTFAGDALLLAAVVSGAAVALARPQPRMLYAAVSAATGLALGLDSPPRAIALHVAVLTLVGTGIGASAVIALVAGAARYLQRDWQRVGVRILGSWITASAALVLALHFTRGQLF
jgi:urease accessory protein